MMAGSRNFGFRFFVEVPFEISGVEHSKDLIKDCHHRHLIGYSDLFRIIFIPEIHEENNDFHQDLLARSLIYI
jgi:hypothetical protein